MASPGLYAFARKAVSYFPKSMQETLLLNLFAITKVPMIYYTRPKIIRSDSNAVEVKMPLFRHTKNHWNSMYIGALVCGIDVAGGWLATQKAEAIGGRVNLIFKDVHVDFLRRPDGDVHYLCDEGDRIEEAVSRALDTDERVNLPVKITARVPSISEEPVAVGTLTLSMKKATSMTGAV